MSDRINTLLEKHLENKKTYIIEVDVPDEIIKIDFKNETVKSSNKTKYLETTIPPEERTLDNLPKYSDGKPKVNRSKWLGLKKSPELWPKLKNVAWGWSSNGNCYGWSHRSIGCFKKGDKIRRDTIGNDSGKEFTIKSHKEAEIMAKKFAKEVS